MTASVIGALRVNLGLDSAQFERGAKKSQSTLKAMRSQFAAVSAAAAAMGAALGGLTIATAQTATELRRLAQVSNTAPATLQKWSAGTRTVGIEQEKLSDILKDVNDRVGDFVTTGGGPMADFFDQVAPKIGITADAFRDLSGADALQLFVASLEKANLSQAEMTFYMEAMASDSTLLLPLLRDNAAEMDRLGQNAASLGAIMSNETVAALDRANMAVADVSLAFQGMRNRIAAELAPALTVLATGFADAMREGGALRVASDALITNIDRLGVYAGVAAAGFGIRYVAALALATGATVSLSGALVVLRGALLRTGIGVAIVAAGELVYWMGRAFSSAGSLKEGLSRIFEVGKAVFVGVGQTAWGLSEILGGVANGIAASFVSAFALIGKRWDSLVNGMAKAWDAIAKSRLGETLGLGTLGRSNVGGTIQGFADDLTDTAVTMINRGGERIKAAGQGVADAVRGSVEPIGDAAEDLGSAAADTAESLDNLDDATKGAGKSLKDTAKDADKLANDFEGPLTSAVDSVADAFGDFFARGFRDFKSFKDSIVGSFRQMISQMISTAIANPIKIALGIGGSVAGGAAQAATGAVGGIGGVLGGLGSLAGSGGILGAAGGIASGLGGILSGGGLSASFANLGGLLSGSVSGLGAIGAAIPAVAVIGLAIAAFKKKVKVLDTGLDVAIDGVEAAVSTFTTKKTTRFFGLSSKTRTTTGAAGSDVADPIQAAVTAIQQSVIAAAAAFDFGADAFEGFTYEFRLSLKGLSEDAQMEAINAELTAMGDAFAAMLPAFSSMTELVEAATQRLQIEDRLLALQGRNAELLARQRERELASVHALNRPLLEQVYALEDQAVAAQAAADKLAEANAQIAAFASNSNNFATRADQTFAATSAGYRATAADVQSVTLLQELIRAVREGDLNNARLTTRLVQMQERAELEPTV